MVNRIIIQIYEIQTPSEAAKLIELGVDHIGSVIVSQARWKVSSIKETIRTVDNSGCRSSLIPLFNHMDSVLRVLDYYQPDIIHFCESPAGTGHSGDNYTDLIGLQKSVKKRLPGIKIMRSIPIPRPALKNTMPSLAWARMFEPVSDYFLIDTFIAKKSGDLHDQQPVGGFVGLTGQTCDWETAATLVKGSGIPVILAGGISSDNVLEGVLQVRPAGVDTCTRTNAADTGGRPIRFKKDLEKVKRFVEEVRRAERLISKNKFDEEE
jgi:phosphoribosylanthranilate isomerase